MKARVFVSSGINEFRSERRIAKEELPKCYPFLEVWVFEEEGASSASLERSFQGPLEKNDLVIFLLGDDITPPVKAEIDSAIQLNKRTLLILRDVPHRSEALQEAIKKLDVKYARYAEIADFLPVLRSAVEAEIVSALQRPPERSSSDPHFRVLKEAFFQGAELHFEPLFPSSDNRFRIIELSVQEMKIEKGGPTQYQLAIPLASVESALRDGREYTVTLRGRIQWISSKGSYKLFSSPPIDVMGVPKLSSPGDKDAEKLRQKLEEKGYYSQWNQKSDVRSDGYEVAYDDDGKYFRCEDRIRPGSVEILVARRPGRF